MAETLEDKRDFYKGKGYRFRIGQGAWFVFHGGPWGSRDVARGREKDDEAAIKKAIEAAAADFVVRRVDASQ